MNIFNLYVTHQLIPYLYKISQQNYTINHTSTINCTRCRQLKIKNVSSNILFNYLFIFLVLPSTHPCILSFPISLPSFSLFFFFFSPFICNHYCQSLPPLSAISLFLLFTLPCHYHLSLHHLHQFSSPYCRCCSFLVLFDNVCEKGSMVCIIAASRNVVRIVEGSQSTTVSLFRQSNV